MSILQAIQHSSLRPLCMILLGGMLVLLPFKVHALKPDSKKNVGLHLLVAEMALQRHQPAQALNLYIQASQETCNPLVAKRATQLAIEFSDIPTALVPALIWAKAAPRAAEAQLTTAALYLRNNQIDQSLPYLHQLIGSSAETADQQLIVLYTEFSDPKDKQAVIQALQALLNQKPDTVPALIALSDIAVQNGLFQASLALSAQALQLAPQNTNAHIIYTESLRQEHTPQAAIDHLEESLKKQPKNAYLRYYLCTLYLQEKQANLAKKQGNILAQLSEQTPLPGAMLLQISQLALQERWDTLAQTFLEQASHTADQKSSAHYFLGKFFENKGKQTQALTHYRQVQEGPFLVVANLHAALLLQRSHQPEQALILLDDLSPHTVLDFKKITLLRAHLLLDSHQSDKALDTLNQAITLLPDDPDLLFARGTLLEQQGSSTLQTSSNK